MKLDMAPGCTLVLVLMLMTAALSRTGAVPVPSAPRALPPARGCHMAQFKSLSPQELQAFKTVRDAFEDSRLQKDWDCGGRLFPRTRDLKHLQVWERPVALEAELALTLTVLDAMANSSLGRSLEQPLLTLQHIHSKLQACVSAGAPGRVWALTAWASPSVPGSTSQPHPSLLCPQVPAQPTAGPRPRGRLHHWLHRLQEAQKKESQDCLEASVMFNLFRLLTRDLKCVASGDQCV
ncbi:interferon lambda-3-like isoform X1 [Ovis canadensis]|uniref:interferon lambda-3-like isoform X1 n=1 Tax=Ovis canadensis TaxID=37174 RepID=UPI0037510850